MGYEALIMQYAVLMIKNITFMMIYTFRINR